MYTLAILGSLGGIVAFIGGVWVIARGLFKLVASTDDNTTVLQELSGKMDAITFRVNNAETDIAVLKDRVKRP